MKLEGKRNLIARTLNVGKDRIVINTERLSEIKEAITKQDIKDLFEDKAISVKQIKGTRKNVKRKTRRRMGSIKKNPQTRKQDYVKLTRKFRAHVKNLKTQKKISQETFQDLRKKIRAREFRSLANLKEHITLEESK
tara:strand:- start:4739 stop:5149 length:411 start_codon:yes stop_codon:yes gene_type:complete